MPYASIFSFLLLLAGIGCFCGPFYMGLQDLEDFVRRDDTLNLNKENEILWFVSFIALAWVCMSLEN